jgi:hypothetical protein
MILELAFLSALAAQSEASPPVLKSPDSHLVLTFETLNKGQLTYSVTYKDKPLTNTATDWGGHVFQSEIASGDDPAVAVTGTLPHYTAWRVLLVGDEPGALIESNVITCLNPESAIKDTSWIHAGLTAGARQPLHRATLPFTRMLAGPMDYTPGGFDNATEADFVPRPRP